MGGPMLLGVELKIIDLLEMRFGYIDVWTCCRCVV
jgi:hypothetical protein